VSENGNANIQNYVACCNTLNKSLQKQGYHLTVLTNKAEEIFKYGYNIKVENIEFNLSIPKDIRFFLHIIKLIHLIFYHRKRDIQYYWTMI
jgi:hypothetical protein